MSPLTFSISPLSNFRLQALFRSWLECGAIGQCSPFSRQLPCQCHTRNEYQLLLSRSRDPPMTRYTELAIASMPAMQTTTFAAIVSNWFQSEMLVNSRLNTPDRMSDRRQKPARTLSQPITRVI